MSVILTNRQKKLTLRVNEGTTTSPSLKNRVIGSGYWINPNETVATDAKLYQLAQYFGNLQVHTIAGVTTEVKGTLEDE